MDTLNNGDGELGNRRGDVGETGMKQGYRDGAEMVLEPSYELELELEPPATIYSEPQSQSNIHDVYPELEVEPGPSKFSRLHILGSHRQSKTVRRVPSTALSLRL